MLFRLTKRVPMNWNDDSIYRHQTTTQLETLSSPAEVNERMCQIIREYDPFQSKA